MDISIQINVELLKTFNLPTNFLLVSFEVFSLFDYITIKYLLSDNSRL